MIKWHNKENARGFTIIELLVVIVIVGILATVTLVVYRNVQRNAAEAKMKSDLVQFSKAVQAARLTQSKTLGQITGSYYSAGSCFTKPNDTDFAALPDTDPCWSRYLSDLATISDLSGMNIRRMVDPWGRPYAIDENEGEGGTGCNADSVRALSYPFVTNTAYSGGSGTVVLIPKSGFSGCTP